MIINEDGTRLKEGGLPVYGKQTPILLDYVSSLGTYANIFTKNHNGQLKINIPSLFLIN